MNRRWLSRYLSYVLRHSPEDIGIELDERGWTDTTQLIENLWHAKQLRVTLTDLERLVQQDRQSRYSIRGNRIRANGGHTAEDVRLVFEKVQPPPILYFGLPKSHLEKCLRNGGLEPQGSGDFVSLCSSAIEADRSSGCGTEEQPYIIVVESEQAAQEGVSFFKSESGRYLCERVPMEFFLDQQPEFRFQVSAGGVVVRDHQVRFDAALMRTRKRWELPKGKLQKGERGWEAAQREVQEELGLTGQIRVGQRLDRLIYFFRNHFGQPRLKTVLLFLIHYQGCPDLHPRRKEGVLDAEWVSLGEAQQRLLFSGGRYLKAIETAEWLLRKKTWSRIHPPKRKPRRNSPAQENLVSSPGRPFPR